MSTHAQVAQELFDVFQAYMALHGNVGGPYGDILYAIGFPHRHFVAHGATLAYLSRLFAEENIAFTYFYDDEDDYSLETPIEPTEYPHYENVRVSATQDPDAYAPPSYTQTAQKIFTSLQEVFSTFLKRRSRQGKFSHSGSYGDLLHIARMYEFNSAAHGTVLAELARLFKEINVSFTYCYGDGNGNASNEQISLTDDADHEDVYVSLSC